MAEHDAQCTICHALVDEEDLFCANCGAEVPHAKQSGDDAVQLDARETTHNFRCAGCGASMSYDASAQNLRCPFCGSEKLDRQADAKTISPTRVVPFAIHKEQADAITRQWLGTGWLRPSDLSEAAIITKMAAVYVPYWVFSAHTHTYWTADTSQTPGGARGDWFPLSGEHQGHHAGVIVGASGALTPAETHTLCPFHLDAGVPPDRVDLDNVIVEEFNVARKYARPLARSGLEELERKTIAARYVPGRSRNVKVNTMLTGLTSEPTLLPVWIMAYTYRDTPYRFLINGQTGEPYGQKPTSYRKVLAIAAAVIVAILALLFCMGVFGAIGSSLSQVEPLGVRFMPMASAEHECRPTLCSPPLQPQARFVRLR